MILYFYGSDTYRLRRYAAKVAGEYEKKHGIKPVAFDVERADFLTGLTEFCAARSLFVSKRCGIVDVSADQPKELKPLLKSIALDKEITLILVSDHKLPKEFDSVLKEATLKEFEPLSGAKVLSFVKEEAAQLGLSVNDTMIREVVGALGEDLWLIMSELEAVSFGKQFEAPRNTPAFFPLIQGMKGGGVIGKQLGTLYHLLEHHEPAMVFNMIASMADASTKMQMADYDVAIKSGKLDYPEALVDLVLSRS